MIADRMDLASIVSWRQTCIANYAQSTASLDRTLLKLLNPFVSHPSVLLRLVADYGAVIGGETALAYIRRDEVFRPRTLEIFAGRLQFGPLCRAISSSSRLSTDIVRTATYAAVYPLCTERDVEETLVVHLRSGLDLYVRQSSTPSPLSPVARAVCTALMNFVTPRSFGCAYPRLTLNGRALLCDVGMRSVDHLDAAAMAALVELGIETAVCPAHWPEYRLWSSTPDDVDSLNACWRSHHICPDQARYFGDRGSFVDYVSPLECGAKELRAVRAPPFGATIVWRLSSSYRCVMDCDGRDVLLPRGVLSQGLIFVYDRLQNVHAPRLSLTRGRAHCVRGARPSRMRVLRRSRSLP